MLLFLQLPVVLVRAASTRFWKSGGSILSAWRKSKISPLACLAPAFICAARPRGQETTLVRSREL
jgi:hypothetical protein